MEGANRQRVFARKAILGLAITQIVLGVACVICGAVAVDELKRFTRMGTVAFQAWLEAVFISAGITGVVAFKVPRVGVVISYMVLSIIATVCTVPIIVLSMFIFVDYDDAHIVLAILCIGEFAVAMASSILCCRAVCCCGVIGKKTHNAYAEVYEVAGSGENQADANTKMVEPQPAVNETEKVDSTYAEVVKSAV